MEISIAEREIVRIFIKNLEGELQIISEKNLDLVDIKMGDRLVYLGKGLDMAIGGSPYLMA